MTRSRVCSAVGLCVWLCPCWRSSPPRAAPAPRSWTSAPRGSSTPPAARARVCGSGPSLGCWTSCSSSCPRSWTASSRARGLSTPLCAALPASVCPPPGSATSDLAPPLVSSLALSVERETGTRSRVGAEEEPCPAQSSSAFCPRAAAEGCAPLAAFAPETGPFCHSPSSSLPVGGTSGPGTRCAQSWTTHFSVALPSI